MSAKKGFSLTTISLAVLIASAISLVGWYVIGEQSNEIPEKYDNAVSLADRFKDNYLGELRRQIDLSCSGDDVHTEPTHIIVTSEENSDGSVKKYFVIAKYGCITNPEDTATPNIEDIEIDPENYDFAVLQSRDGTKWEFTYGDSGADRLPSYIYDTDPELIKSTYNSPERF